MASTHPNHRMLLATTILVAATLACSTFLGSTAADPTSPAASGGDPTGPAQAESTAVEERPALSELPVPAGECANGLLPLERGNQWTYAQLTGTLEQQAGEGTPTPTPTPEVIFTWTVVEVSETEAVIRIESDDPPISGTYSIECEEGAILGFPTAVLNIGLPGETGGTADLSYERSSGVFLPSLATLEENNWDHQWENELAVSGEITTTFTGDQTSDVTFEESSWLMSMETTGSGDDAFESISVPAGEYAEALKVLQNMTMEMNMSIQGATTMSMTFTSRGEQWFVEGVGLVRTKSLEGGMDMGEFDLPQGAVSEQSEMILLEFTQVDP